MAPAQVTGQVNSMQLPVNRTIPTITSHANFSRSDRLMLFSPRELMHNPSLAMDSGQRQVDPINPPSHILGEDAAERGNRKEAEVRGPLLEHRDAGQDDLVEHVEAAGAQVLENPPYDHDGHVPGHGEYDQPHDEEHEGRGTWVSDAQRRLTRPCRSVGR